MIPGSRPGGRGRDPARQSPASEWLHAQAWPRLLADEGLDHALSEMALQEQKFDHPAHQIALQEMVEAVRISKERVQRLFEKNPACLVGLDT